MILNKKWIKQVESLEELKSELVELEEELIKNEFPEFHEDYKLDIIELKERIFNRENL